MKVSSAAGAGSVGPRDLAINTLVFEYVDETEPGPATTPSLSCAFASRSNVKRLFKATRQGIVTVVPSSTSIVKKISPRC